MGMGQAKAFFLSAWTMAIISLLVACARLQREDNRVSVSEPLIVIPANASAVKCFAAAELKKHLELITGKKVPIVRDDDKNIPAAAFPFYVGAAPAGAQAALKAEEARYWITPAAVYFRGEDSAGDGKGMLLEIKRFRTGTMSAVYFFLENELGVKWIEPGDENIVFTPAPILSLTERTFDWTPRLAQRELRPNSAWKNMADTALPRAMAYSREERLKKDYDQRLWLRRERMGASLMLNYGHAFTDWWEKYGKIHPEYFAYVKAAGKRGPYADGAKPDRVKMCVSNRALHRQIVGDWLKNGATGTLNLCENDSAGYCECPECLKLDAGKDGEPFGECLTDRYVWFANEVLKLARRSVPDAKGVMYAYSVYRFPPRREKVSDGLVIGFVPSCLRENDKLDADYKAWRAAGAKELFLRPNDMYLDPGLPIGFDKKMYESFKVGMDNGIIGTDYDALHGFWEVSGLGDYALARGNVYPEKDFDYWEDEYCSTFGAAQDDMKAYLRFWRKIWSGRIYPDREKISEIGRYGNFRRGLMWKLTDYLKPSDFDAAAKILDNAAVKALSPAEKRRLEKMRLSCEHSRLTLRAVAASSNPSASAVERLEAARTLLAFRTENRDRLSICWPVLFEIEKEFGDLSGVAWAESFKDNLTPISDRPLAWSFSLDESDSGLKENRQDASWGEIEKNWSPISTTRPWENQQGMPAGLQEKLKSYDGIGWYATRIKMDKSFRGKPIHLVFGAVDESCWVYVNGKQVGERIFHNPDDWKTPFTIRIDAGFVAGDWQTVVVRVEDKAGMGGIWKPVWLAATK